MKCAVFSVLAGSLAAFASAQQNHQITVGSGGLQFTPSQVTAAINDTVTFIFESATHSVTQSSFGSPCSFLANGFNSGLQSATQGAAQLPEWTLEVTSTDAIWFYCMVPGHCQTGMVGAINPPASGAQTFATFQAAAKATTGDGPAPAAGAASPGVGASALGAVSSVATASASSATSSAATTAAAATSKAASTATAASVTPSASATSKPSGGDRRSSAADAAAVAFGVFAAFLLLA